MCYPTPRIIIHLAEKAANDNGLEPDSKVLIWDKGDCKIYLYRNGWNYAARLRCDNIVSAMPVIECHANRWRKTKTAFKDMSQWLDIVVQRRFERRIELEQMEL